MSHSTEIRDNDKKNLTSLLMVEALGGNLQDAIAQARAPMPPEDVEAVVREIEARKKARSQE
jgi:hypothetical protein